MVAMIAKIFLAKCACAQSSALFEFRSSWHGDVVTSDRDALSPT